MPAAILTELVKYSSERYADFLRENSKLICYLIVFQIYSS